MSRTTIDFGIDLGTTNSAVAVLRGTIPDVIKNNDDHDITPSAVFIDKRSQSYVGVRAKARQEDENSVDDVYLEFKRRMGSDFKYEFKTSGRTMSPEEVSAEVLKSLRGDVQQRLGEDLQASVITVPAAFEAKQCAATKRAGELAGFSQCPLLQEPVAAALAYGFQSDVTKEFWLVYDFGGGTFDAAIMKAEDGSISVVNHGGDNYLGGSDIDWAIVEKLVIPELIANHNFPGLSRGNKKWRHTLARIKNPVEAAKIQLSRSESAFIECKLKDADGEAVDFEYKLTRKALIDLTEPLIMRSIDICQRVLKEKNLGPSAIEKVILVGGPTLSPYFRDILRTNLGIQLDHSVDPLTVVAKGAAVFAGTQRLEGKAAPKAGAGQFDVDLKYKPVGADFDPTVRGEVKGPSGASVEGFSIEFSNQKTRWRSGKVPLKAEGRFKVSLLAEKGEQNVFNIELWDSKGGKQSIVPDTLTYTVGLAISEQPIINSIAVELVGNVADVFFKKGDPLPAKTTKVYRSSATLKKGESGDILKVSVVEGEIEHADRNRLLGSLEIIGRNLKRDVPVGAEIEVNCDFHFCLAWHSRSEVVPSITNILLYMGLFDFLKPKPRQPTLPPELEAKMKLVALAAFPGGPQQIESESAQLHALFSNKITRDEAKHILTRAKSLLVISEDKSERRVVPSIVVYSNSKLTEKDASLAYRFMTGVVGDLYSGGDGATMESAVVISATNSLAGIDAEYKWIEKRYGPRNQAWKVIGRMHGSNQNGKSYETFDIECTNGTRVKIIFDITAFYGRF